MNIQLKKQIKIKNKSNIFKKPFLSKVLLSGLTSTIAFVPIAVSVSHATNKVTYSLGDKKFSSKQSAINYVKQNSQVNYVEGYNASWKLSINGQVKTFSNTSSLQQTIYDNYIKEELYKTNVDLSQYENENGVLGMDDSIWENIYQVSEKSATFYQGKNDVAYNNEEDAYKSYFDSKRAYYFNGIYFKSKPDLRTYLVEQYLPNNSSYNKENTIVLQGPNGVKSAPINLSDTNAINKIGNFILNNSKKVISYTNSKTGNEYSITRENMNSLLSNVSINDLDYFHVQSNQGQTRYVIDNDYTDNANLIGPYFYNGTLDVGAFTNKKMWKKVNGVTASVYAESKIDTMIGSFFSSVINDDASLTLSDNSQYVSEPVLFRTIMTDENNNSVDENFITNLKEKSPELAEAVIEANTTLLKGKKYNTFYKIPILYSFLMQRAISWGLGQDVINLIVDYFTNVCNFIQDAIEMVLMDNSLLLSSDGKSSFNAVDFFEIGNPEYDLNTSTEYFLNKLKTTYPSFVAAMNTYISAQNNIAMMSGLIPYSGLDNSYLVDYKICDANLLEKIDSKLQKIYKVFSSMDYESEMLPLYIKNSTNEEIIKIQSLPENEWKDAFAKVMSQNTNISYDTLLSGVGAKNNQYHLMSKAMLDLEIKTYISTGTIVSGGYLSKIYSSDSSKDKLGPFIDLISSDSSLDSFKVYTAILIDKRMNTNILNTQTMSSPAAFAIALIRVIILGLGSATLVGQSISKIYNSSSSPKIDVVDGTYGKWTASPGEDTSSLKAPNENPLYNLFNQSTDNHSSESFASLISQVKSSRAATSSVEIDPNDPSIAKQLDVEKHSELKRIPNNVTNVTIENSDKISILNIDELFSFLKDESVDEIWSKDEVLKISNKIDELTPNYISNVAVVPDPMDAAKLDSAKKFDALNTYTDEINAKKSSSTTSSSYVESLNKKLTELRKNYPDINNYADFDSYQKDVDKWWKEFDSTKKVKDIAEASATGKFSYPLRKDFATTTEYYNALDEWNESRRLLKDYIKNDPNYKDLYKCLDNYPKETSYLSQTNYHKACIEYKTKYDEAVKKAFGSTIDTSWVGGVKPGTGSGTTIGSGDKVLTYPSLTDFLGRPDEFKKAVTAWEQSFDSFKEGWFANLDDNLKQDYLNKVGERPLKQNFTSDFDYWQANREWKSQYNNWVKTNIPQNIESWDDFVKNGGLGSIGTDTPDGVSTSNKTKVSFTEKIKLKWSGSSAFSSISSIVSTVASYALEILGTAFAVMEIFLFIYQLLQVSYTQDFYEYTTADGTNFYWDGGLTVSKFMGLDVTQEKGIDDMKLLTPIQVTLPQVEEYYYFNGVRYYSTDELKKAQLIYVFNGGSFTKNSNFEVNYVYGTDTNSIYNDKGSSLDELLNKVFADLNIIKKEDDSYDISNINKKSQYIANTATSYDNGVVISKSDNYQTVANNIISNIRPVLIAKLPETTNNGISKGNSTSDSDFPGNYWDNRTKTVIQQDATQFTNYIINNTANDLKPGTDPTKLLSSEDYVTSDESLAISNAEKQLYESFKQSFTINSKTVLTNQADKKFSEMNADIYTKTLYIVKMSPTSSEIYFADQQKAMNYVLRQLNFTKVFDLKKTYIYDGMTFSSEKELENWVIQAIKELK